MLGHRLHLRRAAAALARRPLITGRSITNEHATAAWRDLSKTLGGSVREGQEAAAAYLNGSKIYCTVGREVREKPTTYIKSAALVSTKCVKSEELETINRIKSEQLESTKRMKSEKLEGTKLESRTSKERPEYTKTDVSS